MNVVWKYPIDLKDHQAVLMQHEAKILCVQMQDGTPTIWAKVDPARGQSFRHVFVVGTGHYVPDGKTYLGTVQMNGYVWHVFIEEE